MAAAVKTNAKDEEFDEEEDSSEEEEENTFRWTMNGEKDSADCQFVKF